METEVIFADPSSILKGDSSRSLSPKTSSERETLVSVSDDDKINESYLKNKLLDESLTIEEAKALKELDLKMPISLEKIKKNYKKLVKIFHPDVNGNNKDAEEKFKQINNILILTENLPQRAHDGMKTIKKYSKVLI